MTLISPRDLVLKVMEGITSGFLEVVCPNDTFAFGDPRSSLRAMIVVHHEAFFRRVLTGGEIGFGESFTAGEWTSPDLVAVVRLAVRNLNALEGAHPLLSAIRRIRGLLQHRRRSNTIPGSRRNISHHYDLGNDFYSMFLGSTMAYSCGYFKAAEDSLDQAQTQKFDLICRKLRLKPEHHVLEIGTGWGGFSIHLATRYGCKVTTATISRRQHEYAREWVERAGLSGRIDVLLADYRELTGAYDRIVSVEMFEAVGYSNYGRFFAACDRLLKPQGTMCMQTITMNEQRFKAYLRDYDWIQKYIFPGSDLASLAGIIQSVAGVTDMSLVHSEDIGAHYARTLHEWRRRFQRESGRLPGLGFDLNFERTWDYYLAYCEAAFLERHISDLQLVFSKNHNPEALLEEPWSRSDLECTDCGSQRSDWERAGVDAQSRRP